MKEVWPFPWKEGTSICTICEMYCCVISNRGPEFPNIVWMRADRDAPLQVAKWKGMLEWNNLQRLSLTAVQAVGRIVRHKQTVRQSLRSNIYTGEFVVDDFPPLFYRRHSWPSSSAGFPCLQNNNQWSPCQSGHWSIHDGLALNSWNAHPCRNE